MNERLSSPLRIAVYCDHPVTALGLETLFARNPAIAGAVANTLDGAVAICRERNLSLLLIDAANLSDLSILRRVRAAVAAKIVLWVNSVSAEQGFQALEHGVRGIVKKDIGLNEFLAHLSNIQEGHLWIDKELMNGIGGAKATRLSRREQQLVELLAQGLKNKEIACSLNLTENTIKAYLSRLFQKLGVKDRMELALYGLRNASWGTNYYFRPGSTANTDAGVAHVIADSRGILSN